jgi:predicted nucleotidyltransferase
MNRDDAIARIKEIEPVIRSMGATAVYLFGSTARNEAVPSSDVDIFFDRDPAIKFGLIELIGMEHLLEDALGTKVDLTTRDSLHPALKNSIEQSAIRVL